jgi:hypothetical protein
MERMVLSIVSFPFLKNPETQTEKKQEEHPKKGPDDPMQFYSADTHLLTCPIWLPW